MEVLAEVPLQQEIGSSPASFQKFLESQRELFHNQVDHLQNVVVTQCRLTGVNPLSQEMAAGALSIKIGKRPRDLLNPNGVKYMQSVFSIKDDISKKECREISARFGVTITQVRDFFASQRTRVRRFVRLSREKVVTPKASEEAVKIVPTESESAVPADPVPLSSVAPSSLDEAPSCSTQSDTLANIDELDKKFVDSIFTLMGKEETFAGQVKLLEWIRRTQNAAVLSWFLTKGGVMIIATWLNQAAVEEQTSVLLVILEVLSHLPLHKAEPAHLSAILQNVNRLRFYRTSDVSNRAKALLAKWSKMLARTQIVKKPNGVKSSDAAQKESVWEQGFDDIIADEAWQSNLNRPEEILASYEGSEKTRKLEAYQPLELLPSPSDDLNRKHALGLSSNQNKQRRKVMLVEQPGQSNRSPQVSRVVSASQSRPITVDDIKKAKMRAYFMQSKYGKSGSPPNRNKISKTDSPLRTSVAETSNLPPLPKIQIQPKVEEEKSTVVAPPKAPVPKIQVHAKVEDEKGTVVALTKTPAPKFEVQAKVEDEKSTVVAPSKTPTPKIQVQAKVEDEKSTAVAPSKIPAVLSAYLKPKIDLKKNFLEECKRNKIPWQTPSEVRLHDPWGVGRGEDSKEIEVQRNRTRREMETFYRTIQEIPLNPKEPWDREMDYDDSLTPIIPIEQLPDADTVSEHTNHNVVSSAPLPSTSLLSSVAQNSNSGASQPDLELLAVLLKNPELVMALTSGQGGTLSSADTMRLLDTIKAGNSGGGLGSGREERVEVSLPSPTPTTNPGTSNPFSQQRFSGNRSIGCAPQAATASSNIIVQSQMADALNPTALAHVLQQQLNESVAVTNPNYVLRQSLSHESVRSGPHHVMRQQQLYVEPSVQNPSNHAWRDRSGIYSNPQAQTNNYSGNLVQQQPQLGRENQYHSHGGQGFDSRALENSPTRPAGYMRGRNPPQQGHPSNHSQFHGYRDNSGWRRDRRY